MSGETQTSPVRVRGRQRPSSGAEAVESVEISYLDREAHRERIDRLSRLAPARKSGRIVQCMVKAVGEVAPAPGNGPNHTGPNEVITEADPYLPQIRTKFREHRRCGRFWMNYDTVKAYLDGRWVTIARFVHDPVSERIKELEARVQALEEARLDDPGEEDQPASMATPFPVVEEDSEQCPKCASSAWNGETCPTCRFGDEGYGW